MNPSKKKRIVSDAPLAALLAIASVVACNNASHASHTVAKATFVDAHASSVFVDSDPEATDETVFTEAAPAEIPRTPAPTPPRAPTSFTRG